MLIKNSLAVPYAGTEPGLLQASTEYDDGNLAAKRLHLDPARNGKYLIFIHYE